MEHPCLKCGAPTLVKPIPAAGHPPDLLCPKCGTSCIIAGGAPESTISQAEATLGVRFPPSYRSFLAQYGAVGCGGFEVAGLFEDRDKFRPPYWENVVTWNLRKRRGPHGLSPHYVAISHDGSEAAFLLDTSTPELESPVVVLGPGWDFIVVAPDFNAFVSASLHDALRY